MRRVVLDCNGVDPIVDLPGALDVVKAAISAGKLELVGTHVLAEEIEATPDPKRRAELQGGSPAKHSRDALIAATSLVDGCALVTSDKRLRREAAALGIEVLHAGELLVELGY